MQMSSCFWKTQIPNDFLYMIYSEQGVRQNIPDFLFFTCKRLIFAMCGHGGDYLLC